MAGELPAFGLILDAPNYEKILFGFPFFREAGLYKYRLYQLQQQILNPENILRKKKTSLYQVSSRHLELWIEDSFVHNFDQHAFDGLAFAWSRAKRDNIPFLATCNVHFNNNRFKPAPIKSYVSQSLISHIRFKCDANIYLPVIWTRPPRDKNKKTFKDTLRSLRWWLSQLTLRLLALYRNHTVATESLINYLQTFLYRWHLYSTLRPEDLHTPLLLNESLVFMAFYYIVFVAKILYFFFCFLYPLSPLS